MIKIPTWDEIRSLPWGWIGLGFLGGIAGAGLALVAKKGLGIDPVWPDSEILEKKRAEWTAKDYPAKMQEKAIKWAQAWSAGLARRVGLPEDSASKIYPFALDMAESWMRGILGFFEHPFITPP